MIKTYGSSILKLGTLHRFCGALTTSYAPIHGRGGRSGFDGVIRKQSLLNAKELLDALSLTLQTDTTLVSMASTATLDKHLKVLSGNREQKSKQREDEEVVILPPSVKQVHVQELDGRWRKLCGRILPYKGGRLSQLEEQLLVLSGEIADRDWRAASAAVAAMETRWVALLLKLHSDPKRVVRGNLSRLAEMYTLLDAFGSDIATQVMEKSKTAAQNVATSKVSDRDIVELVIWFHSAVRDVKSDTNEEQSAELFQQFASECNLQPDIMRRVSLLILQGKPFTKLQDASSIALMVLDWKKFILGSMPNEYFEYAHRLRMEYRHLPQDRYIARRAGIIEDVLHSRPLFQCDQSFGSAKIRGVLERRARRNLKYELTQLRKNRLPGEMEVLGKAGGPVKSLLRQASYSLEEGSSMTPLFLQVGVNYSLTHHVLNPRARTDRHLLKSTTKLYYVLSGDGQLYRGGCCDTLQKDDSCLVSANVEQYLLNSSNTIPLVYLAIHSPPWREEDEVKFDW